MGFLRCLLWPRRAKDTDEEAPRRRRTGKPRSRSHQPGVYRIEVDNEAGRFHGDGPPFSFLSSSRVILIPSFLLLWVQPARPMIAGYVGGRRELVYRSGSGDSVGVNLVQPLLGARPYVEEDDEAYDEDEDISRSRRPVRARAHGRAAPIGAQGRVRHRRGRADYLDYYRKLPAEVDEYEGGHRLIRARRRDDDESEDDDGEEVVVSRTHRVHSSAAEERHEHRRATRAGAEDDEDSGGPPTRATHVRSQAEERAIQRFVERALRNYDHSKL